MDSTPSDIESCAVWLTFSDALEVSLQADWVSMPATAELPGCTTTKIVTGQSWSTRPAANFDVLTVEGSPSATMERTGCINDTDNMDTTATDTISLASENSNYQITDGSLTFLTGELLGTYE